MQVDILAGSSAAREAALEEARVWGARCAAEPFAPPPPAPAPAAHANGAADKLTANGNQSLIHFEVLCLNRTHSLSNIWS